MKRRRFERKTGTRQRRKLFVIAVEGHCTEPQYFALFHSKDAVFQIKCLSHKTKSDPASVLARLKQFLKAEDLETRDEAWLVIDKDHWQTSQLRALFEWSKEDERYGFALSNPCFEYWLLLHFETSPSRAETAPACKTQLRKHLPHYDKHLPSERLTPARVDAAIRNARQQDMPPTKDWPRTRGSTVYRLVQRILGKETGRPR